MLPMSGFGDGPGGKDPDLFFRVNNTLIARSTIAPTASFVKTEDIMADGETWRSRAGKEEREQLRAPEPQEMGTEP